MLQIKTLSACLSWNDSTKPFVNANGLKFYAKSPEGPITSHS